MLDNLYPIGQSHIDIFNFMKRFLFDFDNLLCKQYNTVMSINLEEEWEFIDKSFYKDCTVQT